MRREVDGVELNLNESTGAVLVGSCIIVSSTGGCICAAGFSWKVMLVACEMRKEWEARPQLPERWYVSSRGFIVDTACGATHAIIVRSWAHVEVRGTATPEQCAQIPAVLEYVRSSAELAHPKSSEDEAEARNDGWLTSGPTVTTKTCSTCFHLARPPESEPCCSCVRLPPCDLEADE